MPKGVGGYQPDTKAPSSRRADFDLRRRIAELERTGGGGGGEPGPPGPPGPGVPVGGTPPQVLTKVGPGDYETAWQNPTGGGTGTDEVWIGITQPTDPALELWYDPDATAATHWYEHIQSATAAIWTIDHNLGFMPNVQVIDSTGANVEGDISYVSDSRVVLTFSGAFNGVAYLS